MFKKSIMIAVPTLAASALIAASLSGAPATAGNGDGKAAPPRVAKAAKAVTTTSCTGKAQKRSWDRGVAGSDVYSYGNGSPMTQPGSVIHIPGPKTGTDVVSVNFSAGTYLSSGGTYGQVKVLKNGLALKPSDNTYGSWHYQTGYGSFSRNYCTKVGKAGATLRVVIDAEYGTGYFQVYDPMVHVEQSD